ncbi:G-type lectin S-receptor-like serine/threonine-protein kinase At4g27290 isoform X2 [Benincasa hispida]|uniref:G-type lectin S-receptor-like serine/threonine-protein kinase At4g27290 isoform X2 n=1 Tax=Benincasa hispida TaxID=102211 RepID=UPI001900338F|nr:G-type lectin S-receptor-like serine/threonine-protein kinase At4g27290 isoform X2 [Benincasa hispida]
MISNFRQNPFSLLCFWTLIPLFLKQSIAGDDTLKAGQSINDTQLIVSATQMFELGFFSEPKSSNFKYLGIWYKGIPDVVVWVANRDNPIINSSATLKINGDGNFVLLNQTGEDFWCSNASRSVKNPIAQLLDTGNLVLRDSNSGSENYVWQSFDYPFDTLLPGMKLGWDLKTGLNRKLISRRNQMDLSSGKFSYGINTDGVPQLMVSEGNKTMFRGWPWFGNGFSRSRSQEANFMYNTSFEISFSYNNGPNNEPSRVVLDSSGSVVHYMWSKGDQNCHISYTFEGSGCNSYELCGNFGLCSSVLVASCGCLDGFEQKSTQSFSDGCVRKHPEICRAGEGFKKISNVKWPDSSGEFVKIKLGTQNCEKECLNDCSCLAYGALEIPKIGPSCVTWFGKLIDIRFVRDAGTGEDLFVRVAASELESSQKKSGVAVVVAMVIISILIFLALISWLIIRNVRRKARDQGAVMIEALIQENELEMPIALIEAATDHFSVSNKIGEGGFGPVYKGKLPSGQEIAVKKLAESSRQGLQEFKNEILFISQLQHRNLVKLLGFCIHQEETLLIYEYMPNKSLDYFLFDDRRRSLLNWSMRIDIIIGIARGLLYLHRDSRLRIIHRDLKAANILLDSGMEPKISDFGIARMFGEDQTETKTKRVVGTFGYMSPEYVIDGRFSFKSDVFSFGVMLLEIVSGKRNRYFFHLEHQQLNLLGHVWKLWNEGRALELIDETLRDQFQEYEALKYINIGLLCIQGRPEKRPTMSSVLSMLENNNMELISPERPGFYEERFEWLGVDHSPSLGDKLTSSSNNVVTITLFDGR